MTAVPDCPEEIAAASRRLEIEMGEAFRRIDVGPQVGRAAVLFAVGRLDNFTAAEAKIWVPRVIERPAAAPWREREDLLADGSAWISRCRLDARQGGWCRRRPDEARGGRLRLGVAVSPAGDRGGG